MLGHRESRSFPGTTLTTLSFHGLMTVEFSQQEFHPHGDAQKPFGKSCPFITEQLVPPAINLREISFQRKNGLDEGLPDIGSSSCPPKLLRAASGTSELHRWRNEGRVEKWTLGNSSRRNAFLVDFEIVLCNAQRIPTVKITPFMAACFVMLTTHVASAEIVKKQTDIRFNAHIRPLLSEYCFACHGPDSASRKADLRLDTRESAMASGVIVPGGASESELIARITSDDPDFMMPPPQARKRPQPEHKQLLARWIDAGAESRGQSSHVGPPGRTRSDWPSAERRDARVVSRRQR